LAQRSGEIGPGQAEQRQEIRRQRAAIVEKAVDRSGDVVGIASFFAFQPGNALRQVVHLQSAGEAVDQLAELYLAIPPCQSAQQCRSGSGSMAYVAVDLIEREIPSSDEPRAS
jgi:hypothetical protein